MTYDNPCMFSQQNAPMTYLVMSSIRLFSSLCFIFPSWNLFNRSIVIDQLLFCCLLECAPLINHFVGVQICFFSWNIHICMCVYVYIYIYSAAHSPEHISPKMRRTPQTTFLDECRRRYSLRTCSTNLRMSCHGGCLAPVTHSEKWAVVWMINISIIHVYIYIYYTCFYLSFSFSKIALYLHCLVLMTVTGKFIE